MSLSSSLVNDAQAKVVAVVAFYMGAALIV
jgi:hypothetical protein